MPIPSHLKLLVPDSNLPRVVIIGGGFAGLNLAKSLKKAPDQIVMLDRNNFHTFQPLLYQVATAGLEPDSIAGPLRKTFKDHKNFVFRMVKVTGLEIESKEVITKVGRLAYDYLVIANGSVTNYFGQENFRDRVLPLKRVVHSLDVRSHLLQTFEQAELVEEDEILDRMMNVVIVGGGPTGVEMAGSIAELRSHVLPKDFPDLDFSRMNIFLLEGSGRLLNGMSDASDKDAQRYLRNMGVDVKLNTLVRGYEKGKVQIGDEFIDTDTVIWAAGVKGRILAGVPETVVVRDRIEVDEFNEVKDVPDVFAIGDVAWMPTEENPKGHPMLAPVAIQQGQHLGKNISRKLRGEKQVKFKYLDKGTMATIGRNRAVVDLPGGLHFNGFFAWVIWMLIHILYLIGFRNRLITINNWIWSYFTYDKGTRLIIRKFDFSSKFRGGERVEE
ncbi:MAG: NAD(P)/FAD-dependent oxidoreductase [Cyclobacteriaceae bacterium]